MDFEEKADHYLAFPKWSVDGRTLYVQWMNRGQDTLKLFACDAASGKAASIHEEKQPTWVDWYEDLTPLADGSLLFISDVDGWRHLYRYAKGEPAVKQLTHGAWRVHQILEVADDAGLVYFLGRPLKSWDTQVMRLKLAGGEPEIVTKDPGGHRAAVSPDGAFVLDTWTSLTTPDARGAAPRRRLGRPRHRRRGLGARFRARRLGPRRAVHDPVERRQVPAAGLLDPAARLLAQAAVSGHLHDLRRPGRRLGAERLAVAVGALLGAARRHHDQRRSPRQRPLRQGRHGADAPPARDVGDDRSVRRPPHGCAPSRSSRAIASASPGRATAATRRRWR